VAKNTKRDVAMNYEHIRYGPNTVGWVRTKNGKFYVDKLPDGKYALFAQLEVTPEAYEHIISGRYRDISVEIDRGKKRLVGLALTNYPAVDGIHQFSLPDEETEVDMEEAKVKDVNEVEVRFSEQLNALQAKLAELEAKLEEERRRAERAERLLQFSEKLERYKGRIPAGVKPVLVELYLFAATHDQEATPVELIDMLLEGLATVNFSEQLVNEGTPTETPDLDPSYVEAVKSIAKRRL